VALPNPEDRAESLRFLLEEGLPGCFPFATGIYPYRPVSAGETTRQRIVDHLKGLGYLYVALDLAGYRTGSLNEGVLS
jgi:hypothetical protein